MKVAWQRKKGKMQLEMPFNLLHYGMLLKLIKSIVLLEEDDVMKKKHELKNVFFRVETILASGIPKTNAQNYGTSLTESIFKANTLEPFQLVIGLKWMYGII